MPLFLLPLLSFLKKYWIYVVLVAAVAGGYFYLKNKWRSQWDTERAVEEATETIERIDAATRGEREADEVIRTHRDRIKVPDPTKPVFELDAYRACLLGSEAPLRPGECDK